MFENHTRGSREAAACEIGTVRRSVDVLVPLTGTCALTPLEVREKLVPLYYFPRGDHRATGSGIIHEIKISAVFIVYNSPRRTAHLNSDSTERPPLRA